MSQSPNYVGGHALLEGKNVLITAAAGTGIGFATAIRCAEEGARALVISDIHERRLGEAADKIEAATGRRPATVLCNVTDEEQVRAMFDLAIREMGHVDVLMNNAGLGGYAKIVDMTDEQWNVVLDVTLHGCFRCTRAALRHMMPGLLGDLQKRGAFGRGAEPWEVANVMVFLASDYSSYMTGESLSVSSQRA